MLKSKTTAGALSSVLLSAMICLTSCLDNVFEPGDVGGTIGTKDTEIRGVILGYNQTMAYSDMGFSLDDNRLVFFNTKEELDRMLAMYPDKGLDSSNVLSYNTGIYPVRVKVKPEGAMITGWELQSSDQSLVEVTDYKSLGIDKILGLDEAVLLLKGVGECKLRLRVKGRNESEAEFPIKVVSTTTLKFKCTPFWMGSINTRVHWRAKDVPRNVKDVVFQVTDSVRVIGEVNYYNHYLYGSKLQTVRDTVTYPNEVFFSRFKKSTYHMLRNVTKAVRQLNGMEVQGTRLEWNSTLSRYDTLWTKYLGETKQVDCVFGIVSDNPYLIFNYEIRPGRTYDRKDKNGDITDGGYDGEERDDDDEDVLEDIETYFKLTMNDGLTAAQRDSIRNSVNKFKKDMGYDADNLTDAERNAIIDRMNNEKNRYN